MSKILFKSVLVVILFHALIPHLHSNELTEKEHLAIHQHQSSFFGFLQVVLHEGVDESLDHLILTQSGVTKEIKKKFSSHTFTFRDKKAEGKKPNIYPTWESSNYFDFFIVNLNGSRGPPSIS